MQYFDLFATAERRTSVTKSSRATATLWSTGMAKVRCLWAPKDDRNLLLLPHTVCLFPTRLIPQKFQPVVAVIDFDPCVM